MLRISTIIVITKIMVEVPKMSFAVLMVLGDCKDGNDEGCHAEHMSSQRRYSGNYYSSKNEKYWSCLEQV